MTTPRHPPAPSQVLGRGLTFAMAAACGIAVANIYYNQPMLGLIERDFPGSALTELIPTATQLGYALGLFLLVPLGDMIDRRRLILGQFMILGLALAAAAFAPGASWLLVASLLVGSGAAVAQQIVPFAASLADPGARGKTIGTVMAGLLSGILFSRALAGFVASHAGWREMFLLGLPLALAAAAALAALLPAGRPTAPLHYGATLKSLASLWWEEPMLRSATMVQAGLFASFSAFWTILALHLEEPRFALGADAAGLFGVVGVVGVIAAPVAGRLADRKGPRLVIGLGALLTLASWAIFTALNSIPGLVAGVVVLDFGVQVALVSNQHVIYQLNPGARNRLNTLFMTGMFLGGAAGSIGATIAWTAGGWVAVGATGSLFAAISLLAWSALRRGARPCQAH